ncbi:HNH endonuclease [Mycobacterium sp. IS-1590]|uniref:HNH endonuclease signature motif containing protein n=1 Tax=Mycobacterium sp. IS-1590 TaxID=1772286 RepID=UPI00074A729A|nr:HNH endonuclease signature motif containing protein [Mycobacterium sp. IS-1590]KUI45166.1 HNH endonuclease [Mycobacterium sp. IS-1590]
MFEQLLETADGANGAGAAGAWARIENAACARRLSAAADVLDRMYAADGSAERDQWILDNYAAVAAEIAPAQQVSLGIAAAQLEIAIALRDRLPRTNAVFLTGAITYRTVAAIVFRTYLIQDGDALAKADSAIAAHVEGWTALSLNKLHSAIDYWVDRYDPAAVRRAENSSRSRYVEVKDSRDGSGVAHIEATVFAHHGEFIDQRLDALAATVCENDPRNQEQRRADAVAAAMSGAQSLTCECGSGECPSAGVTASDVMVHVVAGEDSLNDATPAELDGDKPVEPIEANDSTLGGPAATGPGYVIGRGVVPAPIVAAKLAVAKRRPVKHPGDAPPEKSRVPSAALAWFIRCRDLSCRFPNCDKPATQCDLDHTVPYPRGATQASNLKCLCRTHHLYKTFLGWRDRQHPDGTVEWLSPAGQKYTTHPGSKLLFPSLCRPTAPAVIDTDVDLLDDAVRCLKMPRRKRTREQNRAEAIDAERQRNQPYVDERNKPPPF